MGKTSSNNIKKEFENLRNNFLDLTLRNQLLNYKPRSKTIEVVNQSPMPVYQTLILQKKKMQFVPNKKDRRANSSDKNGNKGKKSRFSALWEHPPIDLSIFSEGDKSLKADLTPKELQKRLFYINQQASTMFQEQGYNILYLAIGFLEWRDRFKPNEVHAAPLILIPVSMERKKVGKSFSLYWNEEDIQSNISLQAKLAEEGIELPEFKITSYMEGVEHYLRDVKVTISKMKNWKVTKHISLGFFSFTKFVMYNDLNPESWEENVDLSKQELIESIFNPSKNKHDHSFNEEDIDKELLYKDMYQVLDADSSQIAVIEDVKAGRNLVVEGPPGTGKSQTIVNVIAELLASGKSVLFVSEKMAALEVVKSRLDGVGLGKFVLELHSHKTKRKKLLKELQKGLNVRAIDDININQILRKLEKLRHQLDDYAEIIHKPLYNVQMSPFELYGMKEYSEDHFSKNNQSKSNSILPLVRFKSPENYTVKDLDDMIIDLENLAELYGTISKNNPWSKCSPKSLLPSDLREIEMLINDNLDALNDFSLESERIYDDFGIKTANTLREYEKSLESLKLLDDKNIHLVDSSVLTNKVWLEDPRRTSELIEKLEEYQMTAKVMQKFNDHVLTEDINSLIKELEKEANKRFKLFYSNSHKKELEYLYKNDIPNEKNALRDLKAVQEYIKYKKEINKINDLGFEYFGELWHLDASIVDLKESSNWIKKFNHLLKEGIYNENTINLLSNSLFDVDSKSEIKDYLDSGDKFVQTLSKLESKLNPRSKLIFKKETKDVPFEKWKDQLDSWRGQISSLHLWSQYLNTKNACLKTSAKLFVDTLEKKNIKKDDIKPLVLGNFADSLLSIVFAENESLATFIGELHQNKISEFKDLDTKIIELNRKRIFQKLNKKIPKVFGAAENPEAKTLAGEFTRKRGHLPVRTLLEKSGGLIKQIKPCFMMSPLSIAQYLDPTNPKLQFDVVIFDEASQVKPEDAFGAFMRAKTAVVMGDTQQLPPTSFFDQMTDIQDVEEVATALDMESILHLCKLSFPVKMLKWHYRSRHETLIAVSNKEFYDNELIVYPSPAHNTPELGLKFKHDPNTIYERGKSSTNPLEARAVVKEIFKHFNKYGDRKSLGVGTFSVAQMNAILEELEIERKQHPELEPLFSDKMKERFFVKNLETIQGDERDVILISIGYGYDQNGKMSLNFGPLNQDGGERRLNVLTTRAREKCIVFSNFKVHDMHLTANPPFGVKALKKFLEYAENISHGNIISETTDDEPFEDAVYRFLRKNGYEVDKKVGCAGFRVDLAILNKNNPGKYIVGIKCDGKIYSSSKVARDRDRLREQVLNGLGWNLYHLWSTDWYRNRDLTRKKLLTAIEEIKNKTFIEELKSMEIKKIPSEDDDLKIVNPIEDEDEISENSKISYLENSNDKEINPNNNEIDENLDIKSSEISDKLNDPIEVESIIDYENNLSDNEYELSEKIDNTENTKVKKSKEINISFNQNKEDIEEGKIDETIDFEKNNSANLLNKLNDIIKKPKIHFRSHLNESEQIKDNNKNIENIETKNNIDDNNIENIESNVINEHIKDNNMTKNVQNINKNSNSKKNDYTECNKDHIINEDTTNETEVEDDELEQEIKKTLGEFSENSFKDHNSGYTNEYNFNIENIKEMDNIEEIKQSNQNNIDTENYGDNGYINNFNDNTQNINNEKINSSDLMNDEIVNEKHENDQIINNETINLDETNNNYENDQELDGIEIYEGISGIDNPLRRNSVILDINKNRDLESENILDKMRSVSQSINEIKNEVKYINKSLKEIENPSAPKKVFLIDRTIEPLDSDYIINNNSINPKNNYSNSLTSNNDQQNSNRSNIAYEDENLENMINDLNEDHIEVENKRKEESNKLKETDNTKSVKKPEKIEDSIVPYKIAKDIPINKTEKFYKASNDERLSIVNCIVESEGPINIDEFIIRVKESCNLKRAGPKFKDHINKAIKAAEDNNSITNIDNFLFPNNGSQIYVRKRNNPNIDLISNEEIEENIKLILNFINPIETKELIKNAARNFGFKMTSKKTFKRINEVIDYMIARNEIINNNEEIEKI
ncbi:hypothetical protein ALNOE001_08090 [Candidatus Methanobinarius endosymbioticus]|uniref:Rhodanese domain-containing protein n=1 Tax=Candidatus Methanobinarius endosymbioticus TaxID=2006182 RepID=A0A366MD09_9EURY|nr:hypothetical protein ALNOE001_08090 [Candidatus Methanobinarius endosymbioticus]